MIQNSATTYDPLFLIVVQALFMRDPLHLHPRPINVQLVLVSFECCMVCMYLSMYNAVFNATFLRNPIRRIQ